jgi:proteasome lid subunit RPN8/RPN11
VWAGRPNGIPDHIFPLENVSRVPEKRFAVGTTQQLATWEWLDHLGLDPLVAYHSHCTGPAVPSRSDMENHDPSLVMLIIGLAAPLFPSVSMYMVKDGELEGAVFPDWGIK